MRKTTILLLLLVLVPLACSQNETTTNETMTNQTNWYDSYLEKAMSADIMTIISVIIGLLLVYILGKLAFKLIKWAVIILAIILLIRMIF